MKMVTVKLADTSTFNREVSGSSPDEHHARSSIGKSTTSVSDCSSPIYNVKSPVDVVQHMLWMFRRGQYKAVDVMFMLDILVDCLELWIHESQLKCQIAGYFELKK